MSRNQDIEIHIMDIQTKIKRIWEVFIPKYYNEGLENIIETPWKPTQWPELEISDRRTRFESGNGQSLAQAFDNADCKSLRAEKSH